MAAALPLTVSTTGRLLFLRCFMKSPDRRRNVVSDWMSLVMSSMALLLLRHLFRCYENNLSWRSGEGHSFILWTKPSRLDAQQPKHDFTIEAQRTRRAHRKKA